MSRQSLRSSSITSTRGRLPSALVSGGTFCFTADRHISRKQHKHPHFYTSLTNFPAPILWRVQGQSEVTTCTSDLYSGDGIAKPFQGLFALWLNCQGSLFL